MQLAARAALSRFPSRAVGSSRVVIENNCFRCEPKDRASDSQLTNLLALHLRRPKSEEAFGFISRIWSLQRRRHGRYNCLSAPLFGTGMVMKSRRILNSLARSTNSPSGKLANLISGVHLTYLERSNNNSGRVRGCCCKPESKPTVARFLFLNKFAASER